jgi:dipeptidyl aminopeptidase/acylaminoacyl peptidase
MSAIETVDTLVVRTPSSPTISPDGSEVVFVVSTENIAEDRTDSALWRLRDGVASPIEELTAASAPAFLSDGTLTFLSATGGTPQVALLHDGEVTHITGPRLSPFGVLSATWSPDASRAAVVVIESVALPGQPVIATSTFHKMDGLGRVGDVRLALVVVNRATGEHTVLRSGLRSAAQIAWSPDGAALAYSTWRDDDWDQHHIGVVELVELATGEGRTLFEGFVGLGGTATMTPDGTALILSGRESVSVGNGQLLRVPLDGGDVRVLAGGLDRTVLAGGGGAYPGSDLRFTPDGRSLLFTIREGGVAQLYAIDHADAEASAHLVHGDTRSCLYGLDTADDGSLVFVRATDTAFAEVEVRAPDGSLRERTALALPESDAADLIVTTWQERWFESSDGTRVQGWLMRPRDASGATPLLLDVHGGPHNAWMPTADPAFLYHQQLVSRGWSVLIVNPRGSDGYGDAFYRGVTGAWGTADAEDLTVGVHALVSEGLADPTRLAVTGYSYGGFSVCSLTSLFPDLFAAAVAGGVVTDLAVMSHTSDLAGVFGRLEMGQGDDLDYAALRAASPIARVQEVRTPTLLLHGLDDQRCPVGQAEAWFAGLREAGTQTQLVMYPGASHLFVIQGNPSQRIDYRERLFAWLDAHV